MTVTFPFPTSPTGIDAAGKGAVLFVPAIANMHAPTLAEINAAKVNLSCILYGWNANGTQSKVSRVKYCSKSDNESLGKVKYQADAIEYDYDPQNIEDTPDNEYGYYAKLAEGAKGFIVDRRGLDFDVPFEAGQIVDVYPVEMGVRNRVQIDATKEGEKLRVQQEIAITDDPAKDAKIAA